MKFYTSFSSLLVILPLLLEAAALPNGLGRGFGGSDGRINQGLGVAVGRFGGDDQNQNQNQKGARSRRDEGSVGSSILADSGPQTSLTLDPSVIGSSFAQDGLTGNGSQADEVASLTTTNNFINFCAGQPIMNGTQFSTSSCNPIPMGQIPNKNNMPSAKFSVPVNGQDLTPNKTFTITLNVKSLTTGNFVNANTKYFAAPQQLDSSGLIIGHSHVVIQPIPSYTDTTPADPLVFSFFKGLNAAAQGGVLFADVTGGLAEGFYRIATINSAANHQPVLSPIAQHGSHDDAVYFSVGKGATDSTFGNSSAITTAPHVADDDNSPGGANGVDNTPAKRAQAGGAKQQQQGKGRRSFTISRQN